MSEVNRFLGADGDTHMKEPPPAPMTNTEPYNTYLRCMLVGSCVVLRFVKGRQDADTWMLSLPMQKYVTALLLQDKPEATTWQCAIPERDRIWPGQQCMLPFICCSILCPIWSSESHMHNDNSCYLLHGVGLYNAVCLKLGTAYKG